MERDTGRKIVLWAAVLLLVVMAGQTMAAIVRGPYLQNGTTDGVTIMWRTSSNVSSKVWYGTSLDALDQTVTDETSKTNHTIRISGLPPAAKYFYQVGMTDETVLAGGNDGHYFVTSPVAGSTEPIRIWVLGDSGMANSDARAVRDAYLELAGNEKEADIWLMLGDNAYNDGTDSQFQAAVFNTYPQILRNKVLWSTRGNHEKSESVYYGVFDLPTLGEGGGFPSGTESYYSFDYGNVHFICLNSEETDLSSNTESDMYVWLEQDLADTTQDWIIAFWHHPPYTKGSHNSDNSEDSGGRMDYMRENALPILEAGGVDMVLTGHSHSYERSYFLNGHYGSSGSFDSSIHVVQAGDGRENGGGAYQKCENTGAVYIVAGSSGKTGGGSLNHPAKLVSFNRLGSLIIDVNNSRLDSRFLRETTGPTRIDDYFTIENCIVDEDAPTPDPMEWLIFPHATGRTSISMTAVTPDPPDDLDNVEYFFACTAGGGNDSVWQSSSTYEDTGLTPGTEYTYKVMVRDTSLNETGFSSEESAFTDPPDTSPPTPDPMTWATPPESTGVYSVLMTATIASDPEGDDPEGVEYFFECTGGGGNDSDWQDSNVYEERELSENTLYTYRVKARDKSPNQNETEWSDPPASARTDIDFPDPGDLNRDRVVDLLDLGLFGLQLGQSGCGAEDFWCGFADIDLSTDVDTVDLSTFVYNWLKGFTVDLGFDTFDSYPDGTRIADLPDWFAGESSSEVQNIGIGGSQGFTSDWPVFTWSAGDGSINRFNWSEMETGDTVVLSMDFEFSDGFEDDAVGWIIGYDSTDLRKYFRVRLDEIGLLGDRYGIEGHWDVEGEGSADVTIAEISDTLTTGSWYRLRAEFTKLTATSVSIDAEAWLLDTAGAEVRKMAVGSIPDTSTLGSKAPDAKYFENDVWPAFRNDAGNDGACDNAYYGFMPTTQ